MKNIIKDLLILLFILFTVGLYVKIACADYREGYYTKETSPYWETHREDYVLILKDIQATNSSANADEIARHIITFANANWIDPIWAAAMIKAESGYNVNCKSSIYLGLGQMRQPIFDNAKAQLDMPDNASVWDAEYNIQASMHYLKYQRDKVIEQYGKTERTERMALLAYNLGYGGAASRGWSENFHVRKVLKNKKTLLSRDY